VPRAWSNSIALHILPDVALFTVLLAVRLVALRVAYAICIALVALRLIKVRRLVALRDLVQLAHRTSVSQAVGKLIEPRLHIFTVFRIRSHGSVSVPTLVPSICVTALKEAETGAQNVRLKWMCSVVGGVCIGAHSFSHTATATPI